MESRSGYVGDVFYFYCPTVPGGEVYSAQWYSTEWELNVVNMAGNACQVTIASYFSTTLFVRCDYYYWIGSGMNRRAASGSTSVAITCNPVNLRLSDSYLTLDPGEGTTIHYTLSPTIYPTPQVKFTSDAPSVATVTNDGYVYAVGPGSATITASNNAGPSATCYVVVNRLPVQSVSIASSLSVVADEPSKQLSFTVYPTNATVESRTWSIADGSDYISLTASGLLSGKKPGTAHVYCEVNGTVTSNKATVYVVEPSFTKNSTSPASNATDISAFVKPSVTYSLALYKGDNFSGITLKSSAGASVDGTAGISGNTVTFTPSKPLAEQASYVLTIPARAVKNKWGTHYTSAVTVNFKTGDYAKLSITASPPPGFVAKGSTIKLTASQSTAKIYYTKNGTSPTVNSSVYSGAITVDKDIRLRAVAMAEGYRQSDVLAADYIVSNADMVQRFPVDEEPMYIYKDAIPFVKFSNKMQAGNKMGDVSIRKNGNAIEYEAIVTDSTLFIVPDEPLELGCTYTVNVPADAATTWQGESCKAASWTFSTGNFATAVSIGGPEIGMAVKTNGALWTWGQRLTKADATNGSYSYTEQAEPGSFVGSDVAAVSSGYMHHALLKRDGSLWMWGRQLCGEFGNGSTNASAQPVKIMNDVKSVSCGLQTTAIIKNDNTLWMCGRNDLGQIDDSRSVKKQFVKVADNVTEAMLGWGFLETTKADGSKERRTWDGDIDSKRKPSAKGNGIPAETVRVEYGWKNAVALGKDGSVWTWGDPPASATPKKVIEGRSFTELAGLSAANKTVKVGIQGKAVLTALPLPLNADYSALTWTSANSSIATVSSRGVVTGVQKGTTTVTAKISSAAGRNHSRQFNVTVEETPSNSDPNGDGTVDVADIATIISYMAGQTGAISMEQVDVNGDGSVDVADIANVISIMAARARLLKGMAY